MSYTPDSQYLEPSLTKIIEGIDEYAEACKERVDNASEWKEDHLIEISHLSVELQVLRTRLVFLKDSTK